VSVGAWRLIGCFHPSQQNTFTGKLTGPMIDAIFGRAREIAGLESASPKLVDGPW
jgi:uracil-DNA glycosylase